MPYKDTFGESHPLKDTPCMKIRLSHLEFQLWSREATKLSHTSDGRINMPIDAFCEEKTPGLHRESIQITRLV